MRTSRLDSVFVRRFFCLPPVPPAPSPRHHDLASFVAYAAACAAARLPASSPTYIGTHYEYTVRAALRRSAFCLHRVGGRDDAGIDLLGTWHLPAAPPGVVRVLVQCKALKTKLGPNLIRELEGTLRHAPAGWRNSSSSSSSTNSHVGVLVSPREATRGVRDALARSAHPLCWMMIDQDAGGVLRQVLWNRKVEDALGAGGALGVEMRYSLGADGRPQRAVLTWNGQDLPDMREVEERMAAQCDEWVASWGIQEPLDEQGKLALLDIVQAHFPQLLESVPAVSGSVLAEADRARVQRLLHDRQHAAHVNHYDTMPAAEMK